MRIITNFDEVIKTLELLTQIQAERAEPFGDIVHPLKRVSRFSIAEIDHTSTRGTSELYVVYKPSKWLLSLLGAVLAADRKHGTVGQSVGSSHSQPS